MIEQWLAKLQPMVERIPPRWRQPWLWGGAGVLLLLAIVLLVRAATAPLPPPHRTAPDTMSFAINGRPTLVFEHAIGNVHFISGPDGQVNITEQRNGYFDAIHIRYQQAGNTIHITSDIENDLMSDTWVDFTVTVPSQAGLSATLPNGGTLEADGLGGQVALSNTNGSIWATNDHGALTTQTQSGSINVTHFQGQLSSTTQNGTITTTDAQLSGQATLQADSGTINFHGSLDRNGHYRFSGTNGLIGITLPHGCALKVDAHSASGAINSDFPNLLAQNHNGAYQVQGQIGSPPQAQLTIQSVSGPIMLHSS